MGGWEDGVITFTLLSWPVVLFILLLRERFPFAFYQFPHHHLMQHAVFSHTHIEGFSSRSNLLPCSNVSHSGFSQCPPPRYAPVSPVEAPAQQLLTALSSESSPFVPLRVLHPIFTASPNSATLNGEIRATKYFEVHQRRPLHWSFSS